MKKSYLFLLILSLLELTKINAQSLSITDLNKLLKLKEAAIDSVLLSCNYRRSEGASEKDFKIVSYVNIYEMDGVVYTRYLSIGFNYSSKSTDISYRVSNNAEATNIVNWLEKNGYKLNTTTIDGVFGGKASVVTSYKSKTQTIGYTKTTRNVRDRDVTYHQFEVSTMY